ncbi:MAG: hypothetical protein JSS32_08410 [Verrucomicrobia bacterium]|nr:hypothetical protein [Verrucomicrobiota bacterium]
MKKISFALTALLCAASPLLADVSAAPVASQTVESKLTLGADLVKSVRAKYQDGVYKEFLQKMDADFQEAQEENQLEGLIALRQEEAAIMANQSKEIERWNSIAQTWTAERNKELVKAVENQKDTPIYKKVHSIVSENDSAVEKAITYSVDLRKLVPGEGKNADENKLVQIDLETEYKQLHLDSLIAGGQSIPDRQEKHLVIRMEKMDRMLEASKNFQDKELKTTVELLAKTADERYAKGIDVSDLMNLARGKIAPSNDAEKKVSSILSSYQGKFTDLTRELLDQNHEAKN